MLFVDDSPGRFRIPATVEQLLAVASVFWAFTANRLYLLAALNDRVYAGPATWGFAGALLVMLAALHFLLLAMVSNR